MAKIEQVKTYAGRDLETIFFRPMLSGKSAEELGIKVMYNMPVPTNLHFWKRSGDVLQKYSSNGWVGGSPADKYQKTIDLHRVKAEIGYSAEDYFTMVYELITNRADINMDDLSGTELEQAETTLFSESIAESIRATMWLGDTTRDSSLNTFDGLYKQISTDAEATGSEITSLTYDTTDENWAEELLAQMWNDSSELLKSMKSQGNLAFMVTSDIYAAYEQGLDSVLLESAYIAKQEGRESLSYRGIPVIDIQVGSYLTDLDEGIESFAILTDRRNLALAVNTNDFPGTEVRMWYNPDLMENRQRAIFMAGCDYLLPELITFAVYEEVVVEEDIVEGE